MAGLCSELGTSRELSCVMLRVEAGRGRSLTHMEDFLVWENDTCAWMEAFLLGRFHHQTQDAEC